GEGSPSAGRRRSDPAAGTSAGGHRLAVPSGPQRRTGRAADDRSQQYSEAAGGTEVSGGPLRRAECRQGGRRAMGCHGEVMVRARGQRSQEAGPVESREPTEPAGQGDHSAAGVCRCDEVDGADRTKRASDHGRPTAS
ncbi:hypothetical protein KXX52_009334, partial [Aspergillus fumigatus]